MDATGALPADDIVRTIFNTYTHTGYKPFTPNQFTILAAFFLFRPSSDGTPSTEVKVISLGTGTKCLPTSHLPLHGEGLHDSHAEVVARRGAIRWLLEEIARMTSAPAHSSDWLTWLADGKYDIRDGVQVGMYVSTLP